MSLVTIVNIPLRNTLETLYTCTHTTEIAETIAVCNTYNISVPVYLYFVPYGQLAPNGALFSGSPMAANSTLIVSQRYMRVGDTIQGKADSDNAVIVTADIIV